MNRLSLGNTISASEIALGCMRLHKLSVREAGALIRTAQEEGINFFDHADIYGGGKSEEIFAKAADITPSSRQNYIIQTKCGICSGYYDFSREHILEAVEGSLRRLKTEYIDVLLLHRPDTLMDPEEVAEAFTLLRLSGKVKYFGVSNMNSTQIEFLQKYCDAKLIINQLQFSLAHADLAESGLRVNMRNPENLARDAGLLEYCRMNEITIQAWSPLQYGMIQGNFLNNGEFLLLNEKLEYMSTKKGIPPAAVAIAWILRHPAKIQAIVGTTSKEHLQDIARAATVTLSREEWYELYCAAGNCLP